MAAGSGELVGEPCDRGEPLRVVAHLAEGIVLRAPLMLDALLAWAVAAAHRLLPPRRGEPCARIEIPIQREPAGRFHLCSEGFMLEGLSERRFKNRRAPWVEYARFGTSKIRRVDIGGAENKSLHVPYVLSLPEDGRIEWWCLGGAPQLRALLSRVHYLGRFAGSGKGKLDIYGAPWTVEPCKPWEGFPVAREKKPLRPLPIDWPGIVSPRTGFRNLTYPSWDHSREELCAIP